MPSEHRYHQILDNVNDAVYTVDLTTKQFTSLNKAGERLTGYAKKELLGKPFTDIIPPELLPLVLKMIRKKIKRDVSTVYEIEIIRKDGSRVPIEISSKISYKDDKPHEILGVARDITERRHIERQREVFVSLITHEIKNPLTAIKMYAQLLIREEADTASGRMGHIRAIQQQISLLNQLMSDFLEVNQLQLGKFQIIKEKFDLDKEIDSIVSSFPKGKHTIVRKGRLKRKVSADKNRIRQVIWNLLSNAVKYSPDADKVVLSVVRRNDSVAVSVVDFGVGLSPSDQKKIFDLFYRTKFSHQSKIRGHGLGLYICQQIVKGHKGKIKVESVEGKGSTFSFTIPLT